MIFAFYPVSILRLAFARGMRAARAGMAIRLTCVVALGAGTTWAGVVVLGPATPPDRVEQQAFTAGERITLRVLLDPSTPAEVIKPALFQRAEKIAKPVPTPIELAPDAADPRITLVRFTAPKVTRISTFFIRLGDNDSIALCIFPADGSVPDAPTIAKVLKGSALRLLVCGRSAELRRFLKDQRVPFEDQGADAPRELEPDSLVVAELSRDDWRELTARTRGPARLVAFVNDESGLPGTYVTVRGPQLFTKVTAPLLPLLPRDPRARATLVALLLAAIDPGEP